MHKAPSLHLSVLDGVTDCRPLAKWRSHAFVPGLTSPHSKVECYIATSQPTLVQREVRVEVHDVGTSLAMLVRVMSPSEPPSIV